MREKIVTSHSTEEEKDDFHKVVTAEDHDSAEFPSDLKNWEHYENDEYAFVSMMTHECRSSITKDILAPFTRITDNKMGLLTVSKCSKFGILKLLSKIPNGKHIHLNQVRADYATEVIIQPVSNSYFNIDGEIFNNDEAFIKLLPGHMNFLGHPLPMTQEQAKFSSKMDKAS